MKAHLLAASLAVALALPGLAVAADPTSTGAQISGPIKAMGPPVADAGNATPQEIADWNEVDAAQRDFSQGDYAKLAPHLPALAVVMAHAPAAYPPTEVVNRTLVMRTANQLQCLLFEDDKPNVVTKDGSAPTFDKMRCAPNTYPQAAFLLGVYADEKGMFEQGLAVLDQGLKLQPGNLSLIAERFAALNGAKRFTELLAFSDPILSQTTLPADFRGLLLRARGFAFGELGRLDEAQAAYEASLVAVPNHPLALNELRYIAKLRAGGAATSPVFISGAQAATPGVPALNPNAAAAP